MLGLPVFGSRTWIWTIAAPAVAASIDDAAICAGVTGTAGLRPGVSAAPVTAQEMITLRCIHPSPKHCCQRAHSQPIVLMVYSGPERPCRRDQGPAQTKTTTSEARVHPASPVLPWPSGR